MVISNAKAARPLRRSRTIESFYFQFLAVALAATIAPVAVPYLYFGSLDQSHANTENTALASLAAAIVSLIAYRRVTAYPGARGFSYILPAFLATYGIAATILLVGRFAYSGSMLGAGLILTSATMFVVRGLSQRGAPMQFYIVPGSEAAIVTDTPRVRWLRLTVPEVPADASAAIVADLTVDYAPEWERMLAIAAISGRTVYHTKQLRESLTGRVQIDHLSENTFGSLLPNLAYFGIKRLVDVLATLLLIPALAVPMLLVAVAIRLDSAGPAFFRQRRMGYRGEPFQVLKFRSMTHRGPADATDPITRHDDQRVTRLGRLLRRTRIDELPQLWNVLKGEMSLIGPRPEAVELSDWYERELPFYAYRHIVRPGITGWAQINQGHVAELDDVLVKLQYDFFYIKNFSAWIDILIVMRTVVIMLTGFGAK